MKNTLKVILANTIIVILTLLFIFIASNLELLISYVLS